MPDRKTLEISVEAVAVGAGSHYPDHDRAIVLQPSVAHHCVLLVIKRIENFHRIEPTDSLYPYERHGLVQRYDAPVARVMRHDGAEVVFAVHELDTGLDIIFVVDTQHQPRLVETGLIVTRYFHLDLKLPAAQGVQNGASSTVNP